MRVSSLVTGVLFAACQPATDTVVNLTVEGLPSQASSLQISATLGCQQAQAPMSVTSNLQGARLHFPPASRGKLALDVSALGGSTKCAVAQGSSELSLSGLNEYSVMVPLETKAGCALRIEAVGSGSGARLLRRPR